MVDSSLRRPPTRRANIRYPVATALLLFPLALAGCAHSQPPPAGSAPSEASAPALVEPPAAPLPAAPARRWSDEVLYFVVLDRFADGDPANNVQVDKKAPGTFHGGDFKGLHAQLDE